MFGAVVSVPIICLLMTEEKVNRISLTATIPVKRLSGGRDVIFIEFDGTIDYTCKITFCSIV